MTSIVPAEAVSLATAKLEGEAGERKRKKKKKEKKNVISAPAGFCLAMK